MDRASVIGLLASLRRSRLTLGRSLLAVFAATWLGLALQPCVAYAQPGDEPASAEQHAGGCHGEPAPEPQRPPAHDCPHCPPGSLDALDCGTALDCKSIGVPAIVSKAAEPPCADLGAWIDLPVPPTVTVPQRQTPLAVVAAHRSPRAPPRPVQQRFCSYLK